MGLRFLAVHDSCHHQKHVAPSCLDLLLELRHVCGIKHFALRKSPVPNIDLGDPDDNVWEVTTTPENFESMRSAFLDKGMELMVSDIMRVPKTTVKLDEKSAIKVLSLMEKLEDNDDVQNVYSNADIPDDVLAQL